jgi:DNA-binding NarL/FixJ family response regulator
VIRLLIAAPSAVVRAGLEALAGSDPSIELAGSFPDLSSVEALRPDVVLAAVPLEDLAPPADGITPAIVLLSGEAPPAWTRDALRLGVRAVLPRDASADEVLAAVEAAATGLAVVDPHDLEALLGGAITARTAAGSSTLTPRELEVLRMMAEGAANKVIAWKLGISEHTVKFHVASILNKLNAGTRAEAVAIGMRKGMILI